MKMGMWNHHGMTGDLEYQLDACRDLGMMPDELLALSDHCEKEAWIWEQMRKSTTGQKKRKHTLIAKFFHIRSRRWRELAAHTDHEVSSEEDKARFTFSS
jgi:hypothetical protein